MALSARSNGRSNVSSVPKRSALWLLSMSVSNRFSSNGRSSNTQGIASTSNFATLQRTAMEAALSYSRFSIGMSPSTEPWTNSSSSMRVPIRLSSAGRDGVRCTSSQWRATLEDREFLLVEAIRSTHATEPKCPGEPLDRGETVRETWSGSRSARLLISARKHDESVSFVAPLIPMRYVSSFYALGALTAPRMFSFYLNQGG